MLFSVFTFNVQAKDYNDGFLAAEGGDFNSAIQQWGPLAEQGHAIAQFNLALLYHSGLGVDLDEAKAVSWYKNPPAMVTTRLRSILLWVIVKAGLVCQKTAKKRAIGKGNWKPICANTTTITYRIKRRALHATPGFFISRLYRQTFISLHKYG